MVLLQHKLSVKLSQRQILTPGLVQMVSVLALNKLELKDMINSEMVENPVLEELEDSVPLIDEVGRKEEDRDRAAQAAPEENPITAVEKKDPFEEIDFGSFFQDYLDPGYRTRGEMEEIERPSFENFLSKPTTLTDHLAWQLGALSLRPEVREAAEQIVGNLNEDGYLIASDEEMLGVAPPAPPEADAEAASKIVSEAAALGLAADQAVSAEKPATGVIPDQSVSESDVMLSEDIASPMRSNAAVAASLPAEPGPYTHTDGAAGTSSAETEHGEHATSEASLPVNGNSAAAAVAPAPEITKFQRPTYKPNFTESDLQEALEVVRQLDPPGVGCRDLRECLLRQLRYHQTQSRKPEKRRQSRKRRRTSSSGCHRDRRSASACVNGKQHKDIAKALGRSPKPCNTRSTTFARSTRAPASSTTRFRRASSSPMLHSSSTETNGSSS